MKVSTKNAANNREKARADAEEICFSPAPAVRRARVGATDDISSFFYALAFNSFWFGEREGNKLRCPNAAQITCRGGCLKCKILTSLSYGFARVGFLCVSDACNHREEIGSAAG
jgi:hypothetical protein